MSRIERRFLRALREAQERGVPGSALPATCRALASALETCGAVERCRAGRGEILRIQSVDAFTRFVSARYPLGLEDPDEEPSDRVGGVRLYGDAKTSARGRYEGVFLRSLNPGTALATPSGPEIPVAGLTAAGGVAAITLDGSRRYRFSGVVAVVENAEPFWEFERELPDVDLALYSAGRLSERVLSWLASDDMAHCRIVHWGDYDPVGCVEYLRIRERCGDRATMHAPPRVHELLPVYGKTSLITGQLETLTLLRGLALPPDAGNLLQLFDRYRRGLEQEALLI